MAGPDASRFECSICFALLLDPVVGRCGHDYCQRCLERWRASQHGLGRPFACPLCRSLLGGAPGEALGVCVRLRETLELLFPEKMKERRQEVLEQSRDARLGMPAQSVAARVLQHSRSGRRTYLRARRSSASRLPPPLAFGPMDPGLPAGDGTPLPVPSGVQHPPSPPLTHQPVPGAFPAGQGHTLYTDLQSQHAHQQQQQLQQGQGGDSSIWVAPQVQFTLGWHDPSEVRGKRGRRRRLFRA